MKKEQSRSLQIGSPLPIQFIKARIHSGVFGSMAMTLNFRLMLKTSLHRASAGFRFAVVSTSTFLIPATLTKNLM